MSEGPIAVLVHRLGPYHHARLCGLTMADRVVAVEFSTVDRNYAWERIDERTAFHKITLFPNVDVDTRPSATVRRRVIEVLQGLRPKVVAIPGWSDRISLMALSWCRDSGVPAVVMSDSTVHDEVRRIWKEAIKRRIVKQFSAGFVAGGPHVEYLTSLGMPKNRIFTGYDVVDNQYFSSGARYAISCCIAKRAEHDLPKNYFLASSRFIRQKNLPRLLKGFAEYRRRIGPDGWQLILLGDGPSKAEVQAVIDLHSLHDLVRLPGFKQYRDLPVYFGLASAFILGSTSEPWGLVVNEAMACGLPVLVSNRCGCASDLVEDGRNGFTFDPFDIDAIADALAKVSSQECDRAAMGQASLEIISQWSINTFVRGLRQAAEAALEGSGRPLSLADRSLLWMLSNR